MKSGVRIGGTFKVQAFRAGKLLWEDEAKNLVPKDGLHVVLDASFNALSDPTYSIGLASATPVPDEDDTMAVHPGWTEVENYDEADRQLWDAVRTNETQSNSASKAVFTIDGTVTVGGAFIATDESKGGVSGSLLCIAAFSQGNKSLSANDLLIVQYTLEAVSA